MKSLWQTVAIILEKVQWTLRNMKFYDKTFAGEYDRRLSEEGYPGRLLKVVCEQLEGYDRVIDVGAGSGFFTVPLAQKGHHVVAVEPSPHMMHLLEGKLDGETRPLVTTILSTWEEAECPRADAIICIHAVYPMKDPESALVKMRDAAPLCLVLVRNEEEMDTLSDRLREKFRRERCGEDYVNRLRGILSRQDVPFRELLVHERREVFFQNLRKEAEYYCEHMDIDLSRVDEVADFIAAQAEHDGTVYRFTSFMSDVIFSF